MVDPLAHIPGDYGWPLVGHGVAFARDARALTNRQWRDHGDVFRTRILGTPVVMLATPQSAREVLLDRDRVFSSTAGWSYPLGRLFDRGLMLRDFDDHRVHRAVMQQAFRRDALAGYLDAVHGVTDGHLAAAERAADVDLHAFLKQLTLDIASKVFLGVALGPRSAAINRAFMDVMGAVTTPVRVGVPGTPFARGLRGRRRLEQFFSTLVRLRRTTPEAADLLSRLCHATDDDGRTLSDDEVVDHMIFLLLAAHDTTTASLTVMLWETARDPAWQRRLRADVAALDGADVDLDNERALTDVDLVFREATRLHPPVPFLPRGALRDTVVDGRPLPAGTVVTVAPLLLHRHPAWWSAPDDFDPDRFARGRDEHRAHSHLFIPFGGGAHTCIGNHFSRLVTKAVTARLLLRHELRAPADRPVDMDAAPIPRPRRPVRLTLRPRAAPAHAGR